MGSPRRRQLVDALIGPAPTRRMALVHAIDDIADSLVTLSLVGSLFFSVSLDASRSRILAYLLLTVAPLALVAPAVGPLLDRSRAGYRTTIVGSQAVRAVLAALLAGSLLSVAFYPIVFGILLLRKAYALAKTAVVAQLSPDQDTLVAASGHIARTGTIAGGVGTAVGGTLLATIGADWLPVFAAVVYLVAAGLSTRIPSHPTEFRPTGAVVRAEVPTDVRVATGAVAVVRASTGALTFLLAFAIKRGGGDAWIFAAALVAAGVGAFAGTFVAPWLHRRLAATRVVAFTLLFPGAVIAVGVIVAGNLPIVVIAFAIGLSGSVSSRAMDGLYGRVPTLVRGRVISSRELVFQLFNVSGAALAVFFTPSPRVGFAVVGAVLVAGGVLYASRTRLSLRREAGTLLIGRPLVDPGEDLAGALVAEAVHHTEMGNHRLAIAIAEAAVRLGDPVDDADGTRLEWETLRPSVETALRTGDDVSADLAVAVVAVAQRWTGALPAAPDDRPAVDEDEPAPGHPSA